MKKIVLIITHVQPVPANAGDSLRLRNLIRFFKDQEYQVVCLFKDWFNSEPIEHELNDLIDNVFFRMDYNNLITNFNKPYKILKAIQRNKIKASFDDLHMHVAVNQLYRQFKPTVVVAEYIFMAPYLNQIPKDVLKIIDTIDVFSRKKEEVCRHGIEFPLACSRKEEVKYLNYGDLIIGIQPQETLMLKELVPDKITINVGVDMPVSQLNYELQQSEKKVLLIVAGGNPNNVHGVENFLKESWGMVAEKHKSVSLRIVGSVCNKLSIEDFNDRVELAGIVDDLDAEYRNATMIVNPVVAGTGLKIKTIEAMSYCKPLVSTPNGVEGIMVEVAEGIPFVVAESLSDFATEILKLLNSEDKCLKLRMITQRYAEKYLNMQYVYQELKNELEKHEKKISC